MTKTFDKNNYLNYEENNKYKKLQKKLIKFCCRLIYFCGFGDCWYEPMEKPIQRRIYIVLSMISNVYILSVIISEVLAAMFPENLTKKEINDNFQFVLGHPTVYIKFVLLVYRKEQIKLFFKRIIEDTRTPFTSKLDKETLKKSKKYIAVLSVTMWICMVLMTIDGIKTHFEEDIPVRTLVTYWPLRTEEGIFINIIRVVIQLHWWYIITLMLAVDSICISAMIYLSFKFTALQLHFKSLRKTFLDNIDGKLQRELEEEYAKAFTVGVQQHRDVLLCVHNLRNALGFIYSFQVVQSIGLIVAVLLTLVSVERSFTFLMANLASIIFLLALTGCYMLAAGNVTQEASLLPTAMFNSGWELCRARAKIRPLIVTAIRCSQDPVIMTAFGIYELSHINFISVVRTSYSFFAVMY